MTTSAKSATDLKPMGDRVVVRPSEQEDVTKGGIYLPDTAQENPQHGEVAAVGPGLRSATASGPRWKLKPATR